MRSKRHSVFSMKICCRMIEFRDIVRVVVVVVLTTRVSADGIVTTRHKHRKRQVCS